MFQSFVIISVSISHLDSRHFRSRSTSCRAIISKPLGFIARANRKRNELVFPSFMKSTDLSTCHSSYLSDQTPRLWVVELSALTKIKILGMLRGTHKQTAASRLRPGKSRVFLRKFPSSSSFLAKARGKANPALFFRTSRIPRRG